MPRNPSANQPGAPKPTPPTDPEIRDERSGAGSDNPGQRDQRRNRRAVRKQAAEQQAKRQRLIGGIAIVVLIALIGTGVLIALNWPTTPSERGLVAAPANNDSAPIAGRTIGNPDAPVEIVEYGDYQCPFCGRFARESEPKLIDDYVDTGQVKLTFKDFAFIGDESLRAAEAATCAEDQDLFWPYHETLFANQHAENAGDFTDDKLHDMAGLAGLDVIVFDQCLVSGKHADTVTASSNSARALGITSTPTFVLNGVVTTYAGYEALMAAIDAELAK